MIHNPIVRRKTRKIRVGSVYVGGDAPISVQSMTNTETCDVDATVAQIERCVNAGADMMRVSVPSMEAAQAFGEIRKRVNVPLIADIHFDYKIALAVADYGADCLRINPGNIGSDEKVREVVAAARHHGISMRIGVNAGSLEKDLQKKYGEPTGEALLESALRHIDILDKLNFHEYKISVKASNVFLTLDAYRLLSAQVDCPLHLGVTEAGIYRTGTVKSAIALGGLLLDGIGDTMRISLAAEPEEEIKIGFDILKSLSLRSNGINFIACPSCSRQEFNVIKVMQMLEERLEDVRTPMDVSVIGCKVNGPGEAKEADIGVVGAMPRSLVYRNGEKSHLIDTNRLVDEIEAMVRQRVKDTEEAKAKEIIRVGG
ncbi:flavodoxin-dependent (E)-4-hydroxy-3-methylbut-2-enyl-diphosphate synthase [Moraxella sp. ZY210820]|uniref:flavodoxin-dependent (E)-4-hydroxy-3-methylbut-2-enyl-diphosphate synthase n=1 Tax=unclassified Moraxella TaxID=2685852 RepID=UPI00272FCAD2|nr:flavodoxin-dependent (E)-4-hydroxy-3-methylbut-2-enyl-diphosphate synthase [Moraxella sp. ZY210820]WLF83173.1 flavodoxin-dependent (E)-4-hydroxy-3-methylbut-2-enyl-diphosphate synthase [Moraxella sp. ZY210820]